MQSLHKYAAAIGCVGLLVMPSAALARHGQDDQPIAGSSSAATNDDNAARTQDDQPNPARSAAKSDDDSAQGADDATAKRQSSGDDGHHGRGSSSPASGRKTTEVFNVRGIVVSVDLASGTVVMTITKASHGGRAGHALTGRTLVVDTSAARLSVSDVNGDGTADLGDVSAGDRVDTRVLLARPVGALPSSAVPAQRFRDVDASDRDRDPSGVSRDRGRPSAAENVAAGHARAR